MIGSVAEAVEPVTGFSAFVSISKDQNAIRFHGIDQAVWVPGNALAVDHDFVSSIDKRRRDTRPFGDSLSRLLCPVDEGEADSRFLLLAPAHRIVEFGNGLRVLSLG